MRKSEIPTLGLNRSSTTHPQRVVHFNLKRREACRASCWVVSSCSHVVPVASSSNPVSNRLAVAHRRLEPPARVNTRDVPAAHRDARGVQARVPASRTGARRVFSVL